MDTRRSKIVLSITITLLLLSPLICIPYIHEYEHSSTEVEFIASTLPIISMEPVDWEPTPSATPTPSPTPIPPYRPVTTPTVKPTPTPSPSPTPTPSPSPTPIPQPIETEYHPATEGCLIPSGGVFNGPSGRETYYNLDMSNVIRYMRDLGYSEEEYPYWIREDGCKMFGDYIMVAANWDIRPKGTILETSLGTAIVVDTGSFVYTYPEGVDIAVAW